MLTFIKTLHTAIWVVMASAIFYIGYCVLRMEFGTLFFIALSVTCAEIVIILVNAWVCPLTNVARRYSESPEPNFDIYLPPWLAKHNKTIFSAILAIILCIYLVRILS